MIIENLKLRLEQKYLPLVKVIELLIGSELRPASQNFVKVPTISVSHTHKVLPRLMKARSEEDDARQRIN